MKILKSWKVCEVMKVVSMAALLAASCQPLFLKGATLTGVCLFDLDSSGNGTGIQVWNTTAEEDRWNLWLTTSRPGDTPDGLTTPFINGPNDSSAAIAWPLQQGFNRFTIYGENSEAKPAYGLNLFFGGRPLPGISALAVLRTNDVVPAFQFNAAPITYGLDEFPIPGAGNLSCADENDVITLVEFHWASPEVYNRDRVSVDFTEPSGQPDFIGTFTLLVGPPNPGGPKASVRVSQVEICWPSLIDRVYQVQYRASLGAGAWNNLGSAVRATGGTQCVPDGSLDPTRRFYRVVELPSP
jgi:hypothetical protein